MNESHCRCPGCGECSAHANAPKLKAEIKRLKAAAQREWVGLTDEEMLMIYGQNHEGKKYSLGRMVEKALRERNT